jgi:hypothetical protein
MVDKIASIEPMEEKNILECCAKFRCALSEATKGVIMQLPINGTGGNPNQINEGGYFSCPEGKTRAEVLKALQAKKSSPPLSSPEV